MMAPKSVEMPFVEFLEQQRVCFQRGMEYARDKIVAALETFNWCSTCGDELESMLTPEKMGAILGDDTLAASGTHSLPPSIPDGSMATASGNAGVVMDAHRQIVKAEIVEARLDEALEIRKNFHGMAAGLTFGNLMDFVRWIDKHVSELEHAVAMTERDAQVGTNGGLSQRWHEEAEPNSASGSLGSPGVGRCAKQLDAAKLRIEEAVKALPAYLHRGDTGPLSVSSRTAMLKIIREIL